MNICPHCNFEYKGNLLFCPNCSNELPQNTTIKETSAMDVENAQNPNIEAIPEPAVEIEPVITVEETIVPDFEIMVDPVIETVEEPVAEITPVPVVVQQPIVAVPAVQPVFMTEPVRKRPHLAFRIVGMALSIAGFVFSIIDVFYSFIGAIVPVPFFSLLYACIFAFYSMPLSIAGLSISNRCLKAGERSAMCRLGKIFGLLGIFITCFALLVGFLFTVVYVLIYGDNFYY